MTASSPTPVAPSQRATITPAPTLFTIISRRVASVHATSVEKRRELINPLLIPEAQVQQGPEMKAPVVLVLPMLLQHPRDKRVVQKISTAHLRVHQVRVKPSG